MIKRILIHDEHLKTDIMRTQLHTTNTPGPWVRSRPVMPNSGRCPSAYSCTLWHIPSRLDGHDDCRTRLRRFVIRRAERRIFAAPRGRVSAPRRAQISQFGSSPALSDIGGPAVPGVAPIVSGARRPHALRLPSGERAGAATEPAAAPFHSRSLFRNCPGSASLRALRRRKSEQAGLRRRASSRAQGGVS
jgi:hypothetical protein